MSNRPRKPQPKKHKVVNRKPAFLAAFRATLQLTAAAKATGIRLSTHYDWLKADPQYRIDYENTSNELVQQLEDTVKLHASEGVKRKLYYRGKPIHIGKTRSHEYEIEWDHPLMLAVLRRFRPEWRDRTETHVTGSVDLVEVIQEGRKRLLEMKREDDSSIAS
jgi:hypothetical protein